MSIPEKLFHGFYRVILAIFFLFAATTSLFKATFSDADYRHRKRQRFGFFGNVSQSGGILLHCVSVGEVVAASALVKRIRAKHPHYPITITTTTPTGAQQVKGIFKESVTHLYLPYDLRFCMKALLNKIRPEKVLITEVELWPNMIDICYQKDIPVYIINARLTDKSAKNYGKFNLLFNPMLQKITGVCAQGKRDYDNYKAMGIAEDKLFLSNNLKFDLALNTEDSSTATAIAQQLQLANRKVLLGASTHDPEEEVLITSYGQLKTKNPDLLLMLTPRHPQRFDKVEKLLKEKGLDLVKLSAGSEITQDTDVVLVDKMGILKSLYSLANIAFVGGSLADRGGHNALEAALFAKPILMGPHTYNNPAICQILTEAGALKIISDSDSLCEQTSHWLSHPDDAMRAGEAGKQVIKENAGAITKTLEVVGIDA